MSEDGSKVKNVDHEYPVYFSVMDENLSWYLQKNIKEFAKDSSSVDPEDEDFLESNKMNAINGLVYGNLHGISMVTGQKINWYLLSLGTEVDMHNVHFHGQTVLSVSSKLFFKSIICSLVTYTVSRVMYLSVFHFYRELQKTTEKMLLIYSPGSL